MNRYSYLHRTHLFHIYHEKALIYTSFSVRSWTTSTVREQLQTLEARRSISNWICRLKNEEMPPPAMHTLKIYIKMSKNALAQSPLMGTLDLKCWNKKYGKPSQQIKLTKQTWANTGWSYYSLSRQTAKTKMIINSFKIPYLRLCYLHSLQNPMAPVWELRLTINNSRNNNKRLLVITINFFLFFQSVNCEVGTKRLHILETNSTVITSNQAAANDQPRTFPSQMCIYPKHSYMKKKCMFWVKSTRLNSIPIEN